MRRKLTLQYSPDGHYFMTEIDSETGERKPPTYGPYGREEMIFQLAVMGVEDYRKAAEFLRTTEQFHGATFEYASRS